MADFDRGETLRTTGGSSPNISADVVKQAYYEPEWLKKEYAALWPRVWQVACRVEELDHVGSYVTYDIGDESVIVVRSSPDRIRAFYNVCQHRGRRLIDGSGTTPNFACKFHGWRWNLSGENEHVTQVEDWHGALDNDDLCLNEVRFDTWGGWVFVTFDPDVAPLREYLGGVVDALDPLRLDEMRYRWRKWMVINCNWKVALEAFNEGYHVNVTHPGVVKFGASLFGSRTVGIHSMFDTRASTMRAEGTKVKAADAGVDVRKMASGFYTYQRDELGSLISESMIPAAQAVPALLPEDATPEQVFGKIVELAMQLDAQKGIEWPQLTPEQYQQVGIDWHIFPNTVILPMASNCLVYRARPLGDDPDKCIFEVSHIERVAKEDVRKVVPERNDDIYDRAFWGEILLQDFQQMEATHKGIKSKGYRGPRLNPEQEQPVANFHRVYHEYVGGN
jgi:phenylpropionate dioxygenase-like ring-hydroxylating dioxygenase large terminal subunit